MQNWAPLIGGCAAGLFALTACSPPATSPPTASQASPGQATDGSSPTSSAPEPVPSATATTPAATEFVATEALNDVLCQADGKGIWSFSGTLSNPGSEAVKYTVAVAVGTTSSVAGHAIIEKDVAAGSKETVRADAFATNAPAGSTCEAVVSK